MKRNMKYTKSAEEIRRIQELRRSNAAQPIKNKKAYSRKSKYNTLDNY
jgi:hypothetical protein